MVSFKMLDLQIVAEMCTLNYNGWILKRLDNKYVDKYQRYTVCPN